MILLSVFTWGRFLRAGWCLRFALATASRCGRVGRGLALRSRAPESSPGRLGFRGFRSFEFLRALATVAAFDARGWRTRGGFHPLRPVPCDPSPCPPCRRPAPRRVERRHGEFVVEALASTGHRGRVDARGQRLDKAPGLTRTTNPAAGAPSRDATMARRLRRRAALRCAQCLRSSRAAGAVGAADRRSREGALAARPVVRVKPGAPASRPAAGMVGGSWSWSVSVLVFRFGMHRVIRVGGLSEPANAACSTTLRRACGKPAPSADFADEPPTAMRPIDAGARGPETTKPAEAGLATAERERSDGLGRAQLERELAQRLDAAIPRPACTRPAGRRRPARREHVGARPQLAQLLAHRHHLGQHRGRGARRRRPGPAGGRGIFSSSRCSQRRATRRLATRAACSAPLAFSAASSAAQARRISRAYLAITS